jgi:virginiamycin B lyase
VEGALWFTEVVPNQLGRITTAGGITDSALPPSASGGPEGIATGSDGND